MMLIWSQLDLLQVVGLVRSQSARLRRPRATLVRINFVSLCSLVRYVVLVILLLSTRFIVQ